jgi:putative transposase
MPYQARQMSYSSKKLVSVQFSLDQSKKLVSVQFSLDQRRRLCEPGTMGRLPRPVDDGLIYHALNRGNNRADIFTDDADHGAFRETLARTQVRYPFRLFGYCVMTNHFHLLLRPEAGQSISRILQSLTVGHTWRFHKRHRTVGHVWQGRFKSPVIQDDMHLLVVLRYIEANPWRAGMVADLTDYRWSSYQAHGLGQADALLSPFPEWASLGSTEAQRQAAWRRKVNRAQQQAEVLAVRESLRTGRPFGARTWSEGMAHRLGIELNPRPRGRPRKVVAGEEALEN